MFAGNISFNYTLGEDSAYFMDGIGYELLEDYYGGIVPLTPELSVVKPSLNSQDIQYLQEIRNVEKSNEEYLAFYYCHYKAMKEILRNRKLNELKTSGVALSDADNVTASLRRPFKKGARLPGGSSRSDEIYVSGLNGFGEIFLKILHEIEDSIYRDTQTSSSGLIEWADQPSKLGRIINIQKFFTNHPFGQINSARPSFEKKGSYLYGLWKRSKITKLKEFFRVDPLWCYVSGLYLAEGSTPKSKLFKMFTEPINGLSFGFTSTENISLDLVIRSLKRIFDPEECISSWKVKVGSQYFPELVSIGLKYGVPMLRGGDSGDGKIRTMEISLSIKDWAISVAPCLLEYEHRYSHVEPTGAGIARIDVSASSSLCRWYFPLLMFAVFGETNPNLKWGQ